MKKNRKKEYGVIITLILIVAVMSVGFAAYSQNLSISGTLKVKASTWSVHYDDDSYTETTGSAEATSKTIDDTSYSFEVTLDKPGDFYEATVNIVNDGSFDANLTKVTMSKLTDAQKKYLTYTVTYNGTEYTSTTDSLTTALSASTGTVPVKVKLTYTQPTSADDLPTSQQTITITGSFDFAQKQ